MHLDNVSPNLESVHEVIFFRVVDLLCRQAPIEQKLALGSVVSG